MPRSNDVTWNLSFATAVPSLALSLVAVSSPDSAVATADELLSLRDYLFFPLHDNDADEDDGEILVAEIIPDVSELGFCAVK